MTPLREQGWYRFVSAPLFTPAGLIFRAGLIILVYLVLHLAGLREYTVLLSGNLPTDNPDDAWPRYLGCVYIFFYFATVLLAPIFLIASLIFIGLRRLFSDR